MTVDQTHSWHSIGSLIAPTFIRGCWLRDTNVRFSARSAKQKTGCET
jgi:hypothetical protein